MKRNINSSIKLIFVLAGLLLSITNSFAQATSAKGTADRNSLFMNSNLLFICGAVFILLIVIYALSKTTIGLGKVAAKAAKKSSVTVLLLLISVSAYSQTAIAATEKANALPEWIYNTDIFLLGFLFFILLLSIAVLYKVNMRLINVIIPVASKVETEFTIANSLVQVRKPTLLRRIYLRLVDSVPVAKEKDILLDHDYDGIKELDNNLPPWWKYGFYITILFAFFYLMVYHVSGVGKLQGDEYKEELLLAQKQKEERMKASADNVNEDNVVALTDAELLGKGKESFQKLCVACHRPDGGGQVGPNLTDEYWIHGGGIKNIFKTITYGVPDKGMISWQSQLSPKQIQQVSSYVLSLKGTNPAGAKEPQGDKWIDETAGIDSSMVASADTLKN